MTTYIYSLSLSEKATSEYDCSPYCEASISRMIVAAKDEAEARLIAAKYRNSHIYYDTQIFWHPLSEDDETLDIVKQTEYIDCDLIGTAHSSESRVISSSEQHGTG